MNVVFVEPFFPSNQRQFPRALAEAGATVIGIGEYPADALDDQLKGWLHHYERVPSVTDVEAMTRAVRCVQDKLWVDRIEATIQQGQADMLAERLVGWQDQDNEALWEAASDLALRVVQLNLKGPESSTLTNAPGAPSKD